MAKNKVEISGINTSTLNTLTHEEMVDLFKKYKHGEEGVKNIIVEGNLKLVLSIVSKYQNRCDNMDDLFQIGVIGLIKAVKKFDLEFNVKFSTYAVFMIAGEIRRYIRDNNQIRISRSTKELSYKIINFREEYLANNYKYPTNEEVCKEFSISEYELYSALNSLSDVGSLFDPVYSDGGDTILLLDQLEDKNNKNMDELLSLRDALSKIKEREKHVIMKRYVEGLSQIEIAKQLSISQAQVSRIENSAINSVKKLIL